MQFDWMMAASVFIFLLTLVLVVWRPRGLNIAWPAMGGAVLALLAGVVTLADVREVAGITWNATLTFVALILISSVLDEIGFFEWSAIHMARLARGDGKRLFVLMTVLGALVSALFANDGAALILTPIVLAMVKSLRFSTPQIVAFVMAGGFIADTTSTPLVISNLVNIISADYFGIGFAEYAARMLLPTVFSLLASLAMLYVVYRKDIPVAYDKDDVKQPREAIKDRMLFILAWPMLGVLLIGYFVSGLYGIPLSFIVGAVALIMTLVSLPRTTVHTAKVIRSAPWNIVVFSIGMYLVVFGLHHAGITDGLARLVGWLSGHGLYAAAIGMGFVAAILSSVMNNLPTVMIDSLAIQAADVHGLVKEALVYANVIGSDLGPKMTPIGSLATLLWLHVLSRKDVRISWGYFMKIGIILTIPVLAVTLTGLWITLKWF